MTMTIGEALMEWARVEECREMVAELMKAANEYYGSPMTLIMVGDLNRTAEACHRKHSEKAGRELLRPYFTVGKDENEIILKLEMNDVPGNR